MDHMQPLLSTNLQKNKNTFRKTQAKHLYVMKNENNNENNDNLMNLYF